MSDAGVPGIRKKGLSTPFRSLLRMQLKLEYGQRGVAEKLGLGKKSRQAYIYLGLVALAFVPMIGLLYSTGTSLASQLAAIGQPGILVILAVAASQFIVFFIGISALMSTLYYATDIETLLAMPLTGRQILVAKVLVSYVLQLVFSSVVMLPFLVPLGLELGNPVFWPYAVLIDLAAPAVPLAVALLATVLIMRATRRLKQKDLFRVAFGLTFFVLVIGFEYVNVNFTAGGPDAVMRALMERNGLVQVISTFYPPLRWAAWALTGSSAASFSGVALFTGVSAFVLLGVAAASQGWFLGGLGKDVSAARRPAGKLFLKQRELTAAIALRDHKVLTRTPTFLLVTLTNMAVVPIMWVIGAIGSRGEIAVGLSAFMGAATTPLVLILAGIQGVLASMNQVASTAISREGASFWLSKMIPVPAAVQIRGKLKYSLAVTLVQLATLLAAAGMMLKLSALNLLIVAVLGVLVSWPVNTICILNDLYSPRLSWTDPHQAMKGNFATLGAMLFSIIYLVVIGLIVGTVYKAGLTGLPVFLLCAAIAGGSGYLLQRYLEDRAEARYNSIEL